jgi:hypothetical protein
MQILFDIELAARMCHSVNSAWEAHFKNIRPLWENESEEKRQGYYKMVAFFASGATYQEVHESFCQSRISSGWKLGDRDEAKKQDPYLLPYSQLCHKMQLRYHIYKAIVEQLNGATW